jgi:hypothetical protein
VVCLEEHWSITASKEDEPANHPLLPPTPPPCKSCPKARRAGANNFPDVAGEVLGAVNALLLKHGVDCAPPLSLGVRACLAWVDMITM